MFQKNLFIIQYINAYSIEGLLKPISNIVLLFLFLSFSTSSAQTNKVIKVFSSSFPPYVVKNKDGTYGGISVVVAKEIFQAAGYTLKFEIAPYKRTVSNFLQQDDAIMTGLFEGIPDYQLVDMTQIGYTEFPTTYFYNSKINPDYKSISDIASTKGKRVAIMSGTGIYEKVITDSGGKLERVTHENQVLKVLSRGRVDFAHSGLVTGLMQIAENDKFSDLRPLNFNVTTLVSGLVFRKGAYSVRDDIKRTILKLHKNGTLKKIYSKAIESLPLLNVDKLIPESIQIRENIAETKKGGQK